MHNVIKLCQDVIKCQDLSVIKKELEKIGFTTEVISFEKDGKTIDNLYAKIGSGSPHLLFNGHYDAVPSGDESLWKHPPFAATIEGGILYGRGIVDMKGGIACFISAVADYLASNELTGSISFVISGDEEDPIVDGTQKTLELLQKRGEVFDFCIVGEPSNPTQIGQEYKIGRRGEVMFEIKSIGLQGHSAYPHLAINPIHNLVELLSKLQNTTLDSGNKHFEPSSLQVTSFDVGNPATNIIPPLATARIDVRFNSEHTDKSVVEWLNNIVKNCKGEFVVSYKSAGDSFLTKPSKEVDILTEAITSVIGVKPKASTGGGTSDARFVKNYCPVVEFGLTNQTMHKINECSSTKDIENLKAIYQKFTSNFFGKK